MVVGDKDENGDIMEKIPADLIGTSASPIDDDCGGVSVNPKSVLSTVVPVTKDWSHIDVDGQEIHPLTTSLFIRAKDAKKSKSNKKQDVDDENKDTSQDDVDGQVTLLSFSHTTHVSKLIANRNLTSFTLSAPGITRTFTRESLVDEEWHNVCLVVGGIVPKADDLPPVTPKHVVDEKHGYDEKHGWDEKYGVKEEKHVQPVDEVALCVYIDGELQVSVPLRDIGPPPSTLVKQASSHTPLLSSITSSGGTLATLTFIDGLRGWIRDAAYWQFALTPQHVTRLAGAGTTFTSSDWIDDQQYRDKVCLWDFNKMHRTLPPSFEVHGTATFETIIDHNDDDEDENKKSGTEISVLSLSDKSYLKLPRGVVEKGKVNTYTLTVDLCLDTLPEQRQALLNCDIEGSSSSDLYVRKDGMLGILGKFGERGCASLKPRIWHRMCIVANLKKQAFSVYIDGKLAVQQEDMKNDKLKVDGRFALDTDFFLFSDTNDKFVRPVRVRRVMISKTCAKPEEVRALGTAHDPMSDGRSVSAMMNSLRNMSYPDHWCLRAMTHTKQQRRLASDWLLSNQALLLHEDAQAKHLKAATNLSAMGWPRSWCSEALKASNEQVPAAIEWLLQNVDRLQKERDAMTPEQIKKMQDESEVPRPRLSIEKPSTSSVAYRLLKSTADPMDISLDTLIQKPAPKRVTTFKTLEKVTQIEEISEMAESTEQALSIAYSRKCILSLLTNWPEYDDDHPLHFSQAFQCLGGLDFLGQFIRLIDFSRLENGLDVVRTVAIRIMTEEQKRVKKETRLNTMEEFTELAPLSRFLLYQALIHLVSITNEPEMDVAMADREDKVLTRWNAHLVVWIFDAFITVVEQAGSTLGVYGSRVLCPQVVNLVFKSVAALQGNTRLSFVRLLSSLIRLDVEFDPESSYVLKDLMNRSWTVQSAMSKYTSFFQSLLELMLQVDKVEKKREQQQPSSSSARTSAPSLDKRVSLPPMDDILTSTFIPKHVMDRRGIIYDMATLHGCDREFRNPIENGLIVATSSTLSALSPPLSSILDREPVPLATSIITTNIATSGYMATGVSKSEYGVHDKMPWVVLEFTGGVRIRPTAYTLRHADEDGKNIPRSWKLEGSIDQGRTWAILSSHSNDTHLKKQGDVHTWEIESHAFYPLFRIVITGENSSGTTALCLSGFELYGDVQQPRRQQLSWGAQQSTSDLMIATQRIKLKSWDGTREDIEAPVVRCPVTKPKGTTRSGPWRTAKSAQVFTSGKHYLEIHVVRDTRPKTRKGAGAAAGLALTDSSFAFGATTSATKSSGTKEDGDMRIIVGVVPTSFQVDPEYDIYVGAQGSWGFAASDGNKVGGLNNTTSTKPVEYGEKWTQGSTIGIELDVDAGTVQFFVDAVAQGIAFTDVKGSKGYQVAVSMAKPQAAVALIGEKVRPPLRKPKNWPWFEQVLMTERTVQCVLDRTQRLPIKFAQMVRAMINHQGIGASESGGKDDKKATTVTSTAVHPPSVTEKKTEAKDESKHGPAQPEPAAKGPLSEAELIALKEKEWQQREEKKDEPMSEADLVKQKELAWKNRDEKSDEKKVLSEEELIKQKAEAWKNRETDVKKVDEKTKDVDEKHGTTVDEKHAGTATGPTTSPDPAAGPVSSPSPGPAGPESKGPEDRESKDSPPDGPPVLDRQPSDEILVDGDEDDDDVDDVWGNDDPFGFAALAKEEKSSVKEEVNVNDDGPIPKSLEDFYAVASSFGMVEDEQVVSCVDRINEKNGKSSETMRADDFTPNKDQLVHYEHIENRTTRDLQIRLLTMQALNALLNTVVPKIDFSVKHGSSALADGVRSVRGLIFWSTKSRIWQAALDATQTTPTKEKVEIDRFKAQRLREKQKCDVRGKRSLFGQLFRALKKCEPTMYRIAKAQRAWYTTFKGEGGTDAGGLYRETIFVLCQELQSPQVPLFILCPNGREGIGQNRDRWVPRPSATRPLHLAMFEFLGQLMGLAIRSRELLNLDLPSIVWKGIIKDTITEQDVLAIDRLSFKMIEQLKTVESTVSVEVFNETFKDTHFTVVGSDQQEYEICKGGREMTLTWSNRAEYCRLLIEYRKNEFNIQCDAIRRGLATVVPYTLLSLFTWDELQMQVCGLPEMNLDLLAKMTKYENCAATDIHIVYFWEIMRNRFDELERAKFLKFVWGRSRLPVRAQDFEMKFTIQSLPKSENNPDAFMPIAHTCFFSVEIPAYTNIDVMHKRLLYAITHCEAIDADFAANRVDAFAEDSDSDDDGDEI